MQHGAACAAEGMNREAFGMTCGCGSNALPPPHQHAVRSKAEIVGGTGPAFQFSSEPHHPQHKRGEGKGFEDFRHIRVPLEKTWKITSQSFLDENHMALHLWEMPHPPPLFLVPFAYHTPRVCKSLQTPNWSSWLGPLYPHLLSNAPPLWPQHIVSTDFCVWAFHWSRHDR